MADEATILAEAAKLPIDERAAHSNWKVRSAAYEYIKTKCSSVFDPSDPCLADFAAVFSKASADGNAAALDKALEALQAFLEKASDAAASRIAGTVCSNIVSKSLGSRPSTVAKGNDCLAAFVEVEQAEKVTTALVEGYSHKVPKVVVGALDATLFLVRSFGGRAMPAQQILKAMAGMFESKDAKARALVKEIVAELARWMGPELIRAALFEKMRDAQKADVEALLAEAPAGRPKPERLTRKEAAKAAAAAATHSSAAGEAGEVAGGGALAAAAVEEEPEQIDSYEFAEPKDIIPELKKDFWDGIVAAKWSERKAACTTLKELASYPRLANGDYGDVNRELKKIISKDSNIQVVAEAMNCIAAICKGMRKDYRGASMTFCPVVLEKFKDKAAVVGKAAAEALDAMARYSFSLVDVAEDVAAALAHQNPKVKESTLIWLAGCVPRETKAAASKLVASIVPAAVKCTDEGAPSIREAAFNFLVQLALKAGSLSALEKGLAKMDEAKRKKLDEMLQEAAKARRAGGAAAAPAAAAAPSRASSSRSLRAPASGGPSPVTSPRSSTTGPPARPAAAASRSTAVRGSAAGKPPAGAGRASRPAATASAGAGGSAAAAAADGDVDETALSGGLLNAHEAKSRLSELLGEELVAALGDAQWKVRLEAMETVVAKAQSPEAAECVQTLVQGVANLPGWDDKNFQVMSRQFEVIRCCAAYPSFGKTDALVAVMGATDKLADLKLKEAAFQMLLAASEAVGPQLVASLLHKRAAAHKNPKVLTEAINWITLAVGDFLLPAFNVKALLGWAKEDLGSANAATRTAAVQMLGCLHTFLGPPLGDMVRADLKPALMATVEAEFAKQPQQSGFTAKRVSRAAAAAAAASTGSGARKGGAKGSAAAAAADEPPSMDDLLPRADISGQITGELVGKLTSANWKERKEGLDEVEGILAAAGGRIQPCVGDLMPALKGRFNDSNKNLIALALSLLAKLAKAMGRAIVREARPVLGPALRCLCDSKSFVRAAVVELLEAWASVAPCDAPFEELLEILPSPKCVSEGMQAAIAWMASVYSSSGSSRASSHDCIAAAVKAAAIGAGYKTVPVREAAGQLMESLISSVGVQAVQGAVQGLDKNLQKTAADALAKAGAAVGPGPAMPAPAAATGGGSRPGTSSAASRPASRPGTAGSRPGTSGGSGASSRPGTAGSAAAVRSSVTASSSMGRGSVAASSAAGLAGALGGDEGPLLAVDRNKEERARKARFKSSKFEIRPEELQTLEAELGALAAPGLRANLFAKDFKKQILAADALRAWISGRQDDSVAEACIACLDLLLRWAVVRLAEGNTQTLVGVTGMLKALFDLLAEQGYRLSDAEVKVYMPGLVEKCGQPTPQMKAECRDLIRRVSTLYPATKVISFIQEGLNSKNNRTRVTCAEEISYLVDKEGPRVYSGAKCDVLAALAKLVAESGKEIRAAALEALGVVYTIEGEAIMKRLGNLNGQQQGILGDRLKTVDRDLAKKGLTAGYRKAEFDAMRASINTDTATVAGAGGFDQPLAAAGSGAAAGGVAAGGYAAAGGYGGVGSSSFGANRARGDSSILAGVGAGAAAGAGGYGAAAAAAAGGLGSSHGAISGLSSTAGLIQLGGAGPADAAPAAAGGRGGFSRQPSAGLLATAEYNAASSQPMLLMTGAGAAAAAIPAQPAGMAGYQQQHQMCEPAAGSAAAAAANARSGSASLVTGLHVQPLQGFTNPAEQRAEFEKCLNVLRGGRTDDVIEVMKLLCYELMDLQRSQAAAAAGAAGAGGSAQAQAVWSLLLEQADELVQLLTGQTQQVFVAASASMRAGPLPPANCRACKYALNTLMNIFGSSALPAGLSQQTLSGLVRVLLMRLVDDHLGRQSEGEALLKALNVLMLKILENSNRNYTFSALLALLLDVPPELAAAGGSGDGNMQQSALAMRWADLVVKCLIKSTKALPQVIQTIDLRGLLLSLHAFFEALGVEEIRRRSHADDKPLRMVKTILHELCKLKGTEIYKYTADIPQHGSASGADGKPVIFPYIDLNIQTLQGNGAIRSSMQQQQPPAAAAAGSANWASNSSSTNPVTPGRGLLAGAGAAGAAAGNGMRPAAAAPQTPGSAMRTQRDGIMAQLSAVFTRLSAHMQNSNKDSAEKRAVLLDIYAISQEQGMPIDKLMAMYLPDTTPAFKSWIVAEMRRIDEEQQQQPIGQQQQQQGYAAAASLTASAEAAPGALAGVYSSGPAAAGAAGAIGGPGGPTMEALKARMSQLQSEKTRILTSPTKQPAVAIAAAPVPIAAAVAPPAPPAAIAAVNAAGMGMGPGSIAAAAVGAAEVPAGGASSGGGSGRNLQDLRSRMKGLAGL